MRGDIKHFIGVDDPYEIPRSPDLRISTAHDSLAESAQKVCAFVAAALGIGSAA